MNGIGSLRTGGGSELSVRLHQAMTNSFPVPSGPNASTSPEAARYSSHPLAPRDPSPLSVWDQYPTASTPPNGSSQPSVVDVVWKLVRRRGRLLLFWCGITLLIALAVMVRFGRVLYRGEGQLDYRPESRSVFTPVYTPPNVQTLLLDLKSEAQLERIDSEFDLKMSKAELQKTTIGIRLITSTERYAIAFDHPDAGRATEIADRMMKVAIERYEENRRTSMIASLKGLREELRISLGAVDKLQNERMNFLAKNNIGDPKSEIDTESANISKHQDMLIKLASDEKSLRNVLLSLTDKIRAMTSEAGNGNATLDPQIATLRANRTAQRNKAREDLEVADNGYKSLSANYFERERLAIRKIITNEEWYTYTGELNKLTMAIKRAQDQIKDLDTSEAAEKELIRKNPSALASGGSGSPYLTKIIDTESRLVAIPDEIRQFEGLKTNAEKRREALRRYQSELFPLETQLADKARANSELSARIDANEALANNRSNDLKVFSPAAPLPNPISTNYLKLVLSVFVVSLLLFLGFVVALDLPKFYRSGEGLARTIRTPVAGIVPLGLPAGKNPRLEALAAQISGLTSQNGAIVVFNPVDSTTGVERMVSDLGRLYATRGEHVLVFDARPLQANQPSVIPMGSMTEVVSAKQVENYINGHGDDPTTCFFPTEVPAIEYTRAELGGVMSGGVSAMYRFQRLFDEMRTRYTIILMISMLSPQGDDSEFISAVAEGIYMVGGEGSRAAELDRASELLTLAGMPVRGTVLISRNVW